MTMINNIAKILVPILLIAACSVVAYAAVQLDGVSFDPAIVAAGDEVDVTINFHDEAFADTQAQYKGTALKVFLEPADTISGRYLLITDAAGSPNVGHLFAQGVWKKTFRVKVGNDAPAAKYKLRIRFQYFVDNRPTDAAKVHDFYIDVKKEGIVLGVANIVTVPSVIRPGDNYVELDTYIENSGHKNSKSVEAILILPEILEHSYTNSNRLWIGNVAVNESKKATFFINVDEDASPVRYDLDLELNYMDLDNNKYTTMVAIPLLVKEKPVIDVVDVKGGGKSGSSIDLEVYLKNTGSEDAEAVDARLITQSSQPFSFDSRSNYIGELKPGETGKAVFKVRIDKDAELKEHFIKMLIRAKGDGDKGDENIYTFNRRVTIAVNSKKTNPIAGIFVAEDNGAYKAIGIGTVLAIVIIGLVKLKMGKRKKK